MLGGALLTAHVIVNWVQSTLKFTGVHWLVCADIRVIGTAWGVCNFIVFICCAATLCTDTVNVLGRLTERFLFR